MTKILSQEEIDALLRGMDDGEVPTKPEEKVESGITSYDLTNQDRIIRGRMPAMEIINDHFCRMIRNTLTTSLRKMVDMNPRGVQMLKFGEFIRTLPVPSSLHIFKMDPLRGHGLLALDPKMVFTLIDVFLGGTGKGTYRIEGREFTAIESRLILRMVGTFLQEMEKAWQPVHGVSIQHVRSEINPQFVSIVSPTDLMIMNTFGLEMEHFNGMITVCYPYALVEPIKNKLYSGYQSDQMELDKTWIKRFEKAIRQAEIEMVVELGQAKVRISELLNLKVGDTLLLENDANEYLVAKVQGVPKYRGRSGLYGSSKAFQIEDRIEPGN